MATFPVLFSRLKCNLIFFFSFIFLMSITFSFIYIFNVCVHILNVAYEIRWFNILTKYMDPYSIYRIYLIAELYFLVTVLSPLMSLALL